MEDDEESNEGFYSDNNFDLYLEQLDELNLNEKRNSDNFNKSKQKKILNINTDIGYNNRNNKKFNLDNNDISSLVNNRK
jgi:hypothetical protein